MNAFIVMGMLLASVLFSVGVEPVRAAQTVDGLPQELVSQLEQSCILRTTFDQQRCDNAIDQFEGKADVVGRSTLLSLKLAEAYWNKSFLAEIDKVEEGALRKKASDLCRRVIERDPGSVEARYALAHYTDDKAERLTQVKKIIELDPTHPRAHRYLARILADAGKFGEAAKELRRQLEVNSYRGPRVEKEFLELVTYLRKAGRTEESAKYLEELLDRLPKLEGIRIHRCFTVKPLDLKPYAAYPALVARIEKLKRYCTNLEHRNAAVAFMNAGKVDEAIKEFQLQLEANPYYVGTYFYLEELYRKKGESAKADEIIVRYFKFEEDPVERCSQARRLLIEQYARVDKPFIEKLIKECKERQSKEKAGG